MNEWTKQMSNHCSIYQKFNEIPSSRDRPDVVEMNPLHYVRIDPDKIEKKIAQKKLRPT